MLVYEDKQLLIKKLTLGLYETNTYILVCQANKESLVIDAPADLNTIIDHLDGTIPQYILLTHDHIDHIGALDMLRTKLRVPLATHEYSSYQLEKPPELLLQDNDVADLGKLKIEVLFTPGHTPGSLCFRVENYLFAGDTLFPGGPGHTDNPEDFKQIIESITNKIFRLPGDTILLPGHGDETTVKQSKEEYAAFESRLHSSQLCGDVTWQDS
jgi:glyoxylase-like metal-dependent hydrolase (beta-lactamase superfamily II)